MTTMNEKFTMADMLKFQKQMNKQVDTAKRNMAARRNMVDVEKTGGKKRHIMMPKNILDKIPPLYAQDGVKDPTVYVKFFNPRGSGTWLGTEYDPASKEFFGYVMGMGDDELGYFSLKELEMNGIERDESFRPKKLSIAKSKVKKSMGMKESTEESLGALISRLENKD